MKYKAVLFDMDGVLVDSEELICKAAILALREFGIEAEPLDFREFVGAGEDKYVGGTAEKLGGKYVPEMKARTYEIYAELAKKGSIVYDGVKTVLTSLKEAGLALAVCSSADLVKVECNLEAIGLEPDFFDALLTGSDVERKKPFPDIYLAGAKAVSLSPAECIVVEDAVNGVQAASAAGIVSIAVTTSFSRELLHEATHVVNDIREILSLILN